MNDTASHGFICLQNIDFVETDYKLKLTLLQAENISLPHIIAIGYISLPHGIYIPLLHGVSFHMGFHVG